MRGVLVCLVLCLVATGPVGASDSPAADGSCWPGPPGSDPTLCPPNDPRYPRHWEFSSRIPPAVDARRMHPAEAALGAIGFSLDTAWQSTTGRDDVVIAVLDSGIRWNHVDLVRKLYLNRGELPLPENAAVHDANADGVFDIEDYRDDSRVGDRNGNGLLDPGDLIRVFSDCRDDDGNGYPDDISGYDFFSGSHCGFEAGDNDPHDETDFGHGTGIASTAAAEANNGIDDAGVCPDCRVLPVRVGDSFVVDANRFARGLVFAADSGALVVAAALGSYNNTPAARNAVDYAYERGVSIIASAADEFSYHHNYPSVYNHTLYVNAVRFNHARDFTKATTFWGVNPCTNFGARVWITVPAVSCSSGATSRLSGVAGLVQSMALEAGHGPLHPEEVYQVLRDTADDLDNRSPDWGETLYRARPGFDQYYGYGRLNAARAVSAVAAGRIPPIVDLWNPRWFAVISPRRTPVIRVQGSVLTPRAEEAEYRLEYALGVEPEEQAYKTIARGRASGARTGQLGTIDLRNLPLPTGPAPRGRAERDRYSVTLRLRATDDRGRIAEARRSFFLFDDPDALPHFPADIGVSGEASPLLLDLDGDGRDEIVLASADGYLRILSWTPAGLTTLRAALDRLPAFGPATGWSGRESMIRGAVAGDLHGRGRSSLVVASREGRVYVFDGRGERIAPFPVAIPVRHGGRATTVRRVERGILSQPVLADLDGKPGLEILVTAMDGHLYAWRHDGSVLEGFPVRIARGDEAHHRLAKIISTPSVGDLDGDGAPEIVLGSNELDDGLAAVYAVRGTGNRHPDGAFVPGWRPHEIPGIRPDLLPTLATGVQMRPALADVDDDGDMEVMVYAVTGSSVVLLDHRGARGPAVVAEYSMVPTPGSEFSGTTFIGGTGSPLLTDTDGDGTRELYAPLLPFRMLTLRSKPGVPLKIGLGLGGWNLPDLSKPVAADPQARAPRIPMLDGFPRKMDDLMVFARPAAADLDGDGTAEILMGSGGYFLHGFRRSGGEAAGFPRFTGGWIFSEPGVGDVDGDGSPDVVTVTREGYLFAWRRPGAAPARSVPAPSEGPAR